MKCLVYPGIALPPSNLVDCYLPRLTSSVFPTSQLAILAERCCIHRESAFSSSGRLPASLGGLLGFLLAAFEILRLLLGRPEGSAESRMGYLVLTPCFLCVFVSVLKRNGGFAFAGTNGHMDWSVFNPGS